MTKDHVFILGAGRSGTKILRDCLGAASDVSCIPYDIGFVWRYGNESILHDELMPHDLDERKAKAIRSYITRFGRLASRGKTFSKVLEKSVPNSLRPLFIKAVFPDAKLIHVVRDGRNVVESAMRNWQEPSDTGYMLDKLRYFPLRSMPYAFWYAKNKLLGGFSSESSLWGPRYEGMQADANQLDLLDVCTKQWMKCVGNSDAQLAELPTVDVMEIRYEDFVSSVNEVKSLCEFANISDVLSVESYYRDNVRASSNEKQRLSDKQIQYIEDTSGNILTRHGYL